MPVPAPAPAPRRSFLARLLGGAAALAGGGLVGRDLAAQAAPAARPAAAEWDMSWVERVTGAHRQVFDAPELTEATVLHQARTWMNGYAEVYGTSDADTSAVLVVRHAAVPMAMNDALWDRLELGAAMATMSADRQAVKDPARDEPARRNPYLNANVKPGDPNGLLWPDGGLDTLIRRGAIVLVCNLALRRGVQLLVERERMPAAQARETVLANLIPGVYVMPSGIFAVARAQEAGCQYIRAT